MIERARPCAYGVLGPIQVTREGHARRPRAASAARPPGPAPHRGRPGRAGGAGRRVAVGRRAAGAGHRHRAQLRLEPPPGARAGPLATDAADHDHHQATRLSRRRAARRARRSEFERLAAEARAQQESDPDGAAAGVRAGAGPLAGAGLRGVRRRAVRRRPRSGASTTCGSPVSRTSSTSSWPSAVTSGSPPSSSGRSSRAPPAGTLAGPVAARPLPLGTASRRAAGLRGRSSSPRRRARPRARATSCAGWSGRSSTTTSRCSPSRRSPQRPEPPASPPSLAPVAPDELPRFPPAPRTPARSWTACRARTASGRRGTG